MKLRGSKLGIIFANASLIASLLVIAGNMLCGTSCWPVLPVYNFAFMAVFPSSSGIWNNPWVYFLSIFTAVFYAALCYAAGVLVEWAALRPAKYRGEQIMHYGVLTLAPGFFYLAAMAILISFFLPDCSDYGCSGSVELLNLVMWAFTAVYWVIAWSYMYIRMDALRIHLRSMIMIFSIITVIAATFAGIANNTTVIPILLYPVSFIGYYLLFERFLLRV